MEQGTQLCETDPEQALGCFEQAQALYPEESAPYISYAYALYCAQDYERCISYIEDELGLGKAYDIEAQSQLSEILGAAYFECDDYAAAASFFRLSTAGGRYHRQCPARLRGFPRPAGRYRCGGRDPVADVRGRRKRRRD